MSCPLIPKNELYHGIDLVGAGGHQDTQQHEAQQQPGLALQQSHQQENGHRKADKNYINHLRTPILVTGRTAKSSSPSAAASSQPIRPDRFQQNWTS